VCINLTIQQCLTLDWKAISGFIISYSVYLFISYLAINKIHFYTITLFMDWERELDIYLIFSLIFVV